MNPISPPIRVFNIVPIRKKGNPYNFGNRTRYGKKINPGIIQAIPASEGDELRMR